MQCPSEIKGMSALEGQSLYPCLPCTFSGAPGSSFKSLTEQQHINKSLECCTTMVFREHTVTSMWNGKGSWVICAIHPFPGMQFPICPHSCLPSPSLSRHLSAWSHQMHVSGILCYCLKASSTGDWECFGLALNLGMRFCQGFYSAACLDPIWASNSQLEHCLLCPFLKTLTKQAKGKSLVKFLSFYDVLTAEQRQKKPWGNRCVRARKSTFNNSFLRAVWFWSSQPSKYVFSGLFPLPLTLTS